MKSNFSLYSYNTKKPYPNIETTTVLFDCSKLYDFIETVKNVIKNHNNLSKLSASIKFNYSPALIEI